MVCQPILFSILIVDINLFYSKLHGTLNYILPKTLHLYYIIIVTVQYIYIIFIYTF